MNIFIVSRDPAIAAKMLCDQHVVKMVTESAQMLSTCHRVLDGRMEKARSNSGKRIVPRYRLDDGRDSILYHAVHFNHPCNVWIRDDITNYDWLVSHTYALCKEYTKRYQKIHTCEAMLEYIIGVGAPKDIPTYHPRRAQEFVQAMPDEYKDPDPVVSYRKFYIQNKSRFARWKYTTQPSWYVEGLNEYQNGLSLQGLPALCSSKEPLPYELRLL